MKFTICQESRIGARPANQDRIGYCYSHDALLMVVADGLGGHLHGEIAAEIATRSIIDSFQGAARPALKDPTRFLPRALLAAHHAILDYALEERLAEAPRTTAVACVVQDDLVHWAHAGDSRLYLMRGGRISAQTRDHSRVRLMVEHGLLSEEEAATHPSRHRIYSCLGGSDQPQITPFDSMPLRDGDILALCTDGLWGPLGDNGILLGLADGNVMLGVPRLLERAEAAAGAEADNLSVIALRWHARRQPARERAVSTEDMAPTEFTTHFLTPDNRPEADAPRPADGVHAEAAASARADIRTHTRSKE